MGSGIGKTDKNATNDILNGQIVATGTPGAKTVSDPNMGLTASQNRNRKLIGLGGKELSSVFANPAPSPQRSIPTNFNFAENQPQWQPQMPPTKTPFFG